MIRYSLTCKKGHDFEGWFASSAAFERQQKTKQIACPTCGSTSVEKALMAPNVVTSKTSSKAVETPVPAGAPAEQRQLVMTAEQRALIQQMRKLRDEVLAKSDYVGPRFAEEARRIHSEEEKPRGIYGEATPSEVESLVEDGIDVYPLPVLPDDQN
jgi:hypothetical protein